jgi:hypothetical protein
MSQSAANHLLSVANKVHFLSLAVFDLYTDFTDKHCSIFADFLIDRGLGRIGRICADNSGKIRINQPGALWAPLHPRSIPG